MKQKQTNRMQRLKQQTNVCLLSVLLAVGFGCGKSAVNTSDEEMIPEAVAVRKAFESASPSYRNPVSEVLNLVKAGNINANAYAEALPQIRMLASNPTISAP